MILKVVFVFCGYDYGYYYSLILAVTSLRITNPNIIAILVTDNNSFDFNSVSSKYCLFDEIIVMNSKYENFILNSRDYKTSLGSIINGGFLYLDNDVLVRRKIVFSSNIFENDLLFVKNMNRQKFNEQINDKDFSVIKSLGVQDYRLPYLNSGVFFSSGTKRAKLFFEKWNEEWMKSVRNSGEHVDQPSLYSVLSCNDFNFGVLDDRYNCQVKAKFWFDFNPKERKIIEEKAFVWHYFLSLSDDIRYTCFEELCFKLMNDSQFHLKDVKELLARRSPWKKSIIFDKYIQNEVLNSPRINSTLREIILGDIPLLLKYKLYKFLN